MTRDAAAVFPQPDVPAPPPGPGVVPAFVAPPTDRSQRRLWVGLAAGLVTVLLCCAGGVAGGWALITAGTDQAKRQATDVATVYLENLLDGNFAAAHSQYCRRLAAQVSARELADQVRRRPFTGYRLDEPRLGSGADAVITLTAHLTGRGPAVAETYEFESQGAELRICDIR
jgi:hypothetical protein